MRTIILTRVCIVVLFSLIFSGSAYAEMSVTSNESPTTITHQKLSLKERFVKKRLQKKMQRHAHTKKVKKQQGSALGKIFVGIILAIIGVLGIVGAIFSVSIGGLLLSIGLIIIGALVILWGVLDVPF